MHYRWFIDKDKQTDEFGVPVSRAEYDEALHPQKKLYQRGMTEYHRRQQSWTS